MTQNLQKPDYIFEASWEVCNKVGGIYTVLSSRAHILKDEFGDNLIFIGPDINPDKENADFREDKRLLRSLKKAAAAEGINIRTGRWAVEGNPIAILIDFRPFFEQKNDIYSRAWNLFGVNSLQAYGDYDEASMFSYAAGMLVKCATAQDAFKEKRIVYQAHEWMTGLGMMFLKAEAPQVATIFTTHATSIGRSIAGNNKLLYKYFHGYNGDQMASELSMEAKHSVEKKAAHYADCLTTVSSFTDRECRQLLEKAADVVLPNGFERSARPMSPVAQSRHILLDTASALIGEVLPADTFIISTSGRNDYRCKGFDVYLESLAQLSARLREEAPQKRVLALIEVPCWVKEPRKDLLEQLRKPVKERKRLPHPFITHELNDFLEDRIVGTIRGLALWNTDDDPVKVMLVPCYLDGKDGILNMEYYDALAACDLCIYPSYYEPWGYTPLEACAYGIPCITTDLSGFGQWVDETLGHNATLRDGAAVLHRDDENYFQLAAEIAGISLEQILATPQLRNNCKKAAAKLAGQARWQDFISQYYKAYDFALSKTL